jgi:hypothetical protein
MSSPPARAIARWRPHRNRLAAAVDAAGAGGGADSSGQGSDSASARPEGASGARSARGGEFSGSRTARQGGTSTGGPVTDADSAGNSREKDDRVSSEEGVPRAVRGRRGTQGQTPTSGGAPVAQPATQP